MKKQVNELGIGRETAEALAGEIPKKRRSKSNKWSFSRNGNRFLVKDIRYSGFWYRYTVGWFLMRRESRFYVRARGLPFVPHYYGKLDGDALIFEEVDAAPLKRVSSDDLSPGFFDNLRECVEELHRRGIVHLDLRQQGNILLTPEKNLKIVDFESALFLGYFRWLQALLIPLFSRIDHSAILKLRLRYRPDEVSDDEKRRYRRYRMIRKLWPVRNGMFRWIKRRLRHRAADEIHPHTQK
jgi:serine/threonine protein kinase